MFLRRGGRKGSAYIFQGIEVFQEKLGPSGLEGLPRAFLEGLDFLGFETKIFGDEDGCGLKLLNSALKLEEYCEKHDIYGVLCHPFRFTAERMFKTGRISELNLKTSSIFPPWEVKSFLDKARLRRVYLR